MYSLDKILTKEIIIEYDRNNISTDTGCSLESRLGCSFCCSFGLDTYIDTNIDKLMRRFNGHFRLNDVVLDDNNIEWPVYYSCWDARHIRTIADIRSKFFLTQAFTESNGCNSSCNSGCRSCLDLSVFNGLPPALESIREVHICSVCYTWLNMYEPKFRELQIGRDIYITHPVLLLWDDFFQQIIRNNIRSWVRCTKDNSLIWSIGEQHKPYLDTVIRDRIRSRYKDTNICNRR